MRCPLNTTAHYEALYKELQCEIGVLSDEALTGIVGFSAGGPVSVSRAPGEQIFVTCELSLYSEQVLSVEGERYELLCRLPIDDDETHSLLTALGNLSMQAQLGHGHTVDVSGVSGVSKFPVVSLNHYS